MTDDQIKALEVFIRAVIRDEDRASGTYEYLRYSEAFNALKNAFEESKQ